VATITQMRTEGSGLYPDYEGAFYELEYDGGSKREGGFGEVFRVASLDGGIPPNPLAVKILKDDGSGARERGYELIGEMMRRANRVNTDRSRCGAVPLSQMPGLLGLPLFRFSGMSAGRKVLGYVMFHLGDRGFTPLDGMIESSDHAARQAYMRMPVRKRMNIARCLVEALEVLTNGMAYLHCDVNAPNLWVNPDEETCALIDYDGGYFLGYGQPGTHGKMGDFLAPEILEDLKRPEPDPLALVGHSSERWSLFVGVSHLLFLAPPLFFLKDVSQATVREYLARFDWPTMSPGEPNWHSANAGLYEWFYQEVMALPDTVRNALALSVHAGFHAPDKRATPTTWERILRLDSAPPKVLKFETPCEVYFRGEQVALRWDVRDAVFVEIAPHTGSVEAAGEIIVSAEHTERFTLVASGYLGEVRAERTIRVLEPPQPQIKFFPLPTRIGMPAPVISVQLPSIQVGSLFAELKRIVA